MLFKSCILVALMALASSSPIVPLARRGLTDEQSNPPFMLIARAPNAPFDNYPIMANFNQMWVGGDKVTVQICPTTFVSPDRCLPPNVLPRTVFKLDNNGVFALQTNGIYEQYLWVSSKVNQKGAVIYNAQHVGGIADDYEAKFQSTEGVPSTRPKSLAVTNGNWVACLDHDTINYQVFVQVAELKDDVTLNSCIQFTAEIWAASEWQY